jgi:Trk-type K+ transport system membrane component
MRTEPGDEMPDQQDPDQQDSRPASLPTSRRPEQYRAMIVLSGSTVLLIGAVALLSLPGAWANEGSASLMTAAFTATSAVTVTGLTVVDPTSWTNLGQLVILALIQLGGIGTMTLASLLIRSLGVALHQRTRQGALSEYGLQLRRPGAHLWAVVVVSVIAETIIAAALTIGFANSADVGLGTAVWWGLFHAVSAWNNAGFGLFGDSVLGFAASPSVLVPIMVAVTVGGLGITVLDDLGTRFIATVRRRVSRIPPSQWRRAPTRPRPITLHTKLTLATAAVLLVAGALLLTLFEWGNPSTLGQHGIVDRATNGVMLSSMARTAGFAAVDTAQLTDSSVLLHGFLMFVGGGSGSTAGGIKVTTLAVLILMVVAEVRGRETSTAYQREISAKIQRQAMTVTALGVVVVAIGVFTLLAVAPPGAQPLDVLFEAISAFGTVGLSRGLTTHFDTVGQVTLMVMMFVGRVGPLVVGTAFLHASTTSPVHYPQGRITVG